MWQLHKISITKCIHRATIEIITGLWVQMDQIRQFTRKNMPTASKKAKKAEQNLKVYAQSRRDLKMLNDVFCQHHQKGQKPAEFWRTCHTGLNHAMRF